MKLKLPILTLLILGLVTCTSSNKEPIKPVQTLYQGQDLDTNKNLNRIAIGSCNRQDLSQEMWPYIQENDPDLWIWLGDNIYGDSEDMEVMKKKYIQQKFGAAYSQFRANVPVIGTWDDHDFGVNDGGNTYPKRQESQNLMLDFLDVPQNAKVRKQAGAYQSYTFGEKEQKVMVILLDSRYHRDDPIKNPNSPPRYLPNEEGTILGEAQWKWLEEELKNSEAKVHLIGNGIQVIPQDHGYEKWNNFPKERERLLALLIKYEIENPVLLSGDRHIGEISKIELDNKYQIIEITSSGMTHSYESVDGEPNRHRVSKLIGEKNFGMIILDWSEARPKIRLELRGLQNKLHTAFDLNP